MIKRPGHNEGADVADLVPQHGAGAVEEAVLNAPNLEPAVAREIVGLDETPNDKLQPSLPGDRNLGVSDCHQDWPDPEPLPKKPAVTAFDPNLLPDSIRQWVADITYRMQVAPDFVAVAAIISLATVVGCKVGIRPKRHDNWLVVANLWGAVIGRPSAKKSPALDAARQPLKLLADGARLDFERNMHEFKATAKVAKAEAKARDKSIDEVVREGKDLAKAHRLAAESTEREAAVETPPTEHRYETNDITVQKLAELLVDNPNGLLVFADELTGFLRSMELDGQEGARAFYLTAWSGVNGHQYDRIGRGSGYVPRVCLSILGGIQPGPFSKYVADALGNGGGTDGFLQRFQLLVWPDDQPPPVHRDEEPDDDAWQSALAVFRRLNEIPNAGDDIPYIHFDTAAQSVFDVWYVDLMERVSQTTVEALEAHLAKYASLVPSLALLIHFAEDGGGAVSKSALVRAISWIEYLETHARRVYSMFGPLSHAIALSKHWKDLPAGFTARDVYNNGWSLLDKAGTDAAIAELEMRRWLVIEKVESGGRPKYVHHKNPKVVDLLT